MTYRIKKTEARMHKFEEEFENLLTQQFFKVQFCCL